MAQNASLRWYDPDQVPGVRGLSPPRSQPEGTPSVHRTTRSASIAILAARVAALAPPAIAALSPYGSLLSASSLLSLRPRLLAARVAAVAPPAIACCPRRCARSA